jgi:hypothetical protein
MGNTQQNQGTRQHDTNEQDHRQQNRDRDSHEAQGRDESKNKSKPGSSDGSHKKMHDENNRGMQADKKH